MSGAPSWVTTSVGIYALLGSVFFIVLIIVTGLILMALLDVGKQVKHLAGKVEELTDKVHGIASQVNAVTTEVGARTTGLVRIVDDSAHKAIGVLEALAPVFVVLGAFMRLRAMASGRRKKSR